MGFGVRRTSCLAGRVAHGLSHGGSPRQRPGLCSLPSPCAISFQRCLPSVPCRRPSDASGMPIRSASLNFTPGRSARSSMSTSAPGRFGRGAIFLHSSAAAASCGSRLHDQHLPRRDIPRPDDAVGVVALLDHRLQRAADADAVAAHRPSGATASGRRCRRRRISPSTWCRA